jgi:universal stress protein A
MSLFELSANKKGAGSLMKRFSANLPAETTLRATHSRLRRAGGSRRKVILENILVPIDFSEESSRALEYALSFAREFESKITLLHVVEPIPCPADFGYGWVNRYKPNAEVFRKAKRQIGAWRRKVGSKWLGKAIVSSGTPFREIINAAKERSMDLIILSTHADVGMSHVVLGSTAEGVVRHAPCPVLLVRNKLAGPNTNN